MSKIGTEIKFGNLTSYTLPSYDSTKLGLGSLMTQQSGGTNEANFVGPMPVTLGRPIETAGAVPGFFPWSCQWGTNKTWLFLADNNAAATKRVQLFELDTSAAQFTWKGFITCSLPFIGTQGTYTPRAFRMTYEDYTTGTASVNAFAVTGTNTTWISSRLAVGSRIGFGSVTPQSIGSWFEIASIISDTSATLTTNAGVISDGSYVLEDLRALQALTNGTTATNAGLFVTKGLRYENFSSVGTNIAASSANGLLGDNSRLTYWIGDATTTTNTVSFGMGLQDRSDWTTQYCWVSDTVANPVLFKYNVRAPLNLFFGKDTSTALVFKTGSGGATTGSASQINNGRVATVNHGPGIGVPCYYFTTPTRVYRTININNITTGSTTWLSGGDVMTEVPPGGAGAFTATSVFNSIEVASSIDKFVVLSTAATGLKSYITQYRADNQQLDRIFLVDSKQINQASVDAVGLAIYPNTLSAVISSWSDNGILYLVTHGTTAATNFIYAFPTGADWEYASSTNQRVIFPQISTPNCNKFYRAYVNEVKVLGGATGKNLGQTTEPYRLYYRTSGISDNSGSWTLMDSYHDLSAASGASSIQFMAEFRIIGLTCIPARLLSVGVMYEDNSTDSHFQPSVKWSDVANKKFAWRFSSAFGSTVPTMRVRLYDAVGGGLLIDNDTTSNYANFEKSTNDGGAWGAYDRTDLGVSTTTYVRYTPSSLADNIKVRALILQA